MRTWSVFGFLFLGLTVAFLPAQQTSFSGTFTGAIEGMVTTLELQHSDGQVTGTVSSDDYTYHLKAIVTGNRFAGQLQDPEMGGGLPVEGLLEGDSLKLILILGDPQTGESQRLEQIFRRSAAGADGSAAPGAMGGPLGAQPTRWAGTFSGNVNGASSSLELEQDGQNVRGRINAGGYVYELAGSLQGESLTGTVKDPQAGGSFPFEGARSGQGVTITLLATDAYGQLQRVPFEFERGANRTPSAGVPTGSTGRAGQQADVQRDPSLVGRWRYSESMTSGDFSMVSEKILVINPDGSYVLGDGRVVGGGGAGSFDSGGGGGVEATGEWRTENRIVYVRDPGGQWQPYARYYVEGSRMMFTFGDNSRQIWHRQ